MSSLRRRWLVYECVSSLRVLSSPWSARLVAFCCPAPASSVPRFSCSPRQAHESACFSCPYLPRLPAQYKHFYSVSPTRLPRPRLPAFPSPVREPRRDSLGGGGTAAVQRHKTHTAVLSFVTRQVKTAAARRQCSATRRTRLKPRQWVWGGKGRPAGYRMRRCSHQCVVPLATRQARAGGLTAALNFYKLSCRWRLGKPGRGAHRA